MKVVILAGGKGTRLREETQFLPKPMVEIGGKPILWHIMKNYSHFGFNDFIICLGYKGEIIRDYFINYSKLNGDLKVTTASNVCEYLSPIEENWNITLVDTGAETQTGGRIKRIEKYIKDETFLATYGDGLSNVNIHKLIAFHLATKGMTTLTGVLSKSRFGEIEAETDGKILSFQEKSKTSWINGGFFVFEPSIFTLINGDYDPLETGLLTQLTALGRLNMYKHDDFWQCIDTYKEVLDMNHLWRLSQIPRSEKAPWRVW
jgi:glucose-1-phosphate cytidylyltransferase